ncbi:MULTISPECIES: hypothetical protein [Haloarcula]|uniref:Uncharacterized protein n=2 Tax=Haloarcula sebkhae TaxID=932660 RepID=A0ACC6VRR7_9EURY|nr:MULTISPECIES: hypothetical protein [Haloarcula]GGK78685.1 hypothetical protein GCM10009067_33790 [Haloarcula sebkhae]
MTDKFEEPPADEWLHPDDLDLEMSSRPVSIRILDESDLCPLVVAVVDLDARHAFL